MAKRMPKKWIVLILVEVIVTIMGIYFAMPLATLMNNDLSEYVLREFVYDRISDLITEDCVSELDNVRALNSWIYVNEEQSIRWLNIKDNSIDYYPLYDFVRGIGWCDQKSWALFVLLVHKDIRARSVYSQCHTITEVYLDDEIRYFDPTFNCEPRLDDGQFVMANADEMYGGSCINSYGYRYGAYNDELDIRNLVCRILDCYPDTYTDWWVDIYFMDGGENAQTDLIRFVKLGHVPPDWEMEYMSPRFAELYEARVYHLLGRYDDAMNIYSQLLSDSQFRDEAIFFSMVVGLQSGNEEIADKFYEMAKSEIGMSDKSYLSFAEPYMKRFEQVYNK